MRKYIAYNLYIFRYINGLSKG